MVLWKQLAISAVVLIASIVVWARYFPGAAPYLERVGVSTASLGRDGPQAAAPGGGGESGGAGPMVIGAEVVQATINDSVSAIGDGVALRSVAVTPYASGRVEMIEVTAGAYVAAGAKLVRLDRETEEIELDRARLTFEDARVKLDRVEQLLASNATTDVAVREAQLELRRAELAQRDAALTLQRRSVVAPFAGWVGIVSVDAGDQVDPETEIVTLDDRSRILVDFRVPERLLGQLRIGAAVTARPLARPGLELQGEIGAIDSRISADTRTIRLRAILDNADDLLRAGMAFAIAMEFPGDTFPAVDPLAIQWSADGAYVWVEDAGAAAQVPIRIVQRNNDFVLVDADLAPGALVVTEGMQMLREGAPLRFQGASTEATVSDEAPDPGPDGEDSGAGQAARARQRI